MEKELHKLEEGVAEASEAREALAKFNAQAVAAKREALQAELGPKRDSLRRVLATERVALEQRQKALEERRQGEQGEALRQVRFRQCRQHSEIFWYGISKYCLLSETL
jgi:hypothetical protein